MRRIWKNIWRLPQTYLPLFFSAVLITTLILISGAVRISCEEARKQLDDQYHVSLTVTLKPKNEKVTGDDGKTQIINRNERLLDRSVLSLLQAQHELQKICYPTNSFFLPLDMMCTDEEYQSMQSHIAARESFAMPLRVYFADNREVYDVGVCACTDQSLAAEALGASAEDLSVTYFGENRFGDGLILPRALYELFGAPDKLAFGWYTESVSGLALGDVQTGASVTDRISSMMADMAQMPPPPTVTLDVVGVYDTGNAVDVLKILTTPDIWNDVWCIYDYYQTRTERGWHARHPDANAWDDLGVRYITCALDRPSEATNVIKALMDGGLSPDSFSIVATDYEYKFALSQINHVTAVAGILHGCAIIFGILCMLLLLRYAVRRRSGEILIRRTLGEHNSRIALTLCTEISMVLMFACAAAVALSTVAGHGLCAAVEQYMESRAQAAVANLSAITEFMKDSAQLHAQLLSAIEAYGNSSISLHYAVSADRLWWLVLCIPCVCGTSLLFALPALKGTLLKRGDVL